MGLGIAIEVEGSVSAGLAAASLVEVVERVNEPTRFRLRLPADIAEGDIPSLVDPEIDPGKKIGIVVPGNPTSEVLVQGPVHRQKMELVHGGAGSVLDVMGADLSLEMDRVVQSKVWPDGKDSDAVEAIVKTYGSEPAVEKTLGRHVESKHSLVQRDTDLRFVQQLARRNGYHFYFDVDSRGRDVAHFEPPPSPGKADAELIIHLKGANIDALSIEWDVERPVSAEAFQLDLNTLQVIDGSVPVSPQGLLGKTGLDGVLKKPRSLHLATPVDDAGDLRARASGALIEAGWFVRARCQTTVDAVGKVIRAHRMVRVRGAGSRHSGEYFVAGVRHLIDSTAHHMEIELWRNAWGA